MTVDGMHSEGQQREMRVEQSMCLDTQMSSYLACRKLHEQTQASAETPGRLDAFGTLKLCGSRQWADYVRLGLC